MSQRTWLADLPNLSPEMAQAMRAQRSRIREQRAAARREVAEYRRERDAS